MMADTITAKLKKVLVTDGDNRAALAITRSLGKSGYDVYVASENKKNLAGSSRYCVKNLSYSNPNKNPDRFRTDIVQLVIRNKIDILMPAAEMTTRECMKIKKEIKHLCKIPFQSYDSVDIAASKYDVLKLAEKLQIPIPETYYLHSYEELEDAYRFCHKIGYPIVIKASRSRVKLADNEKNFSTQYAYNPSDLKHIILGSGKAFFPLLLQERIQGSGIGIFTCYNKGEGIAYFSHRRIREKPPSGGVSVLRESITINKELKEYAAKLLKALEWHGVAMVEFKKDVKRGGYKLMEINGRFWGSLQLAIDAGVDFPLLLARISTDQSVQPVEKYNINVRTRWLWGDIDALLARLLKSETQLNLPESFPDKKQYLKEFLRFKKNELNFEVLKLNDPKPWLIETMRWLHLI
jgi:predicted ATP-grasp superfamily ATP-dependent carboligase